MKTFFTFFIPFLSFIYAQSISFPCTRGGINDGGTILSYGLDNDHARVINFEGTPEALDRYSSGAQGRPGLTYVAGNNAIYGVFSEGGSPVDRVGGFGTLYKFDVVSESFSIIRYFSDYDESEGKQPVGQLLHDPASNRLYGVCSYGGKDNAGVIYYIDLTDDSYHVLHRLDKTSDGSVPKTRILKSNNLLVGMCSNVPNGGAGTTIFTYNLDNGTFTPSFVSNDSPSFAAYDILVDNDRVYFIKFTDIGYHVIGGSANNYTTYFNGLANVGLGSYPIAFSYHNGLGKNLVLFAQGGQFGKGSIAMFSPGSGSGLTNIHSFSGNYSPEQGFTNGTLGVAYGLIESTVGGGSKLYSFDGSGIYRELHTFVDQGAIIRIPPVFVNGKLYGVAEIGGAYDSGIFYSIDTDGSNYRKVADLGYPAGRGPNTKLTAIGNNEYIGITGRGGKWGSGGFFKVDLSWGYITDYKVLPDTAFVQDMRGEIFTYNNQFYSITVAAQGIIQNEKSAYQLYGVDTSSGYLVPIESVFPHTGAFNNDSIYKSIISSGYVQENNMIYGTSLGGLFKFDLNDSSFHSLFRFTDTTLQGYETGNIIKDGDIIYGVNYRGGTNNAGNLWQYNTSNSQFNVLKQFTNEKPWTLTKKGDSIYIFHEKGGANGQGGIAIVNANTVVQTQALDFDSLTTGFITTGLPLLAPDDKIYFLNSYGAANGLGGLIALDPSDNSSEIKLSFTKNTGYRPEKAHLIWRDQLNVSITENELDNSIVVYPNPGIDQVSITAPLNIENIKVFNMQGQLMGNYQYKNINNTKLNTSQLANGTYFIQMMLNNGETYTKQWIKK